MAAIEVLAPAKINLTLHVTGPRGDGYHLLDSLVVFADAGDIVRAAPADRLSLGIEGPEAGGLPLADDNLVLRAARLLGPGRGAALTLVKRLPVAAGLGGGSADAAAALRALAALWDVPVPDPAAAATLGSDVPVCLAGAPARMRGAGERLDPVPALPDADIVLVNPRVAVPTPAVFAALGCRSNPAMPDPLPDWPDLDALASWLRGQRNDLCAPARALAPVIGAVLDRLGQAGGCATGMSGSGATCFALLPPGAGAPAAARLRADRPDWWCVAAPLLTGAQVSRPTT